MEYIKKLSDYKDDRRTAITFGKFDGLHAGHQKLVEKIRELGKANDLVTVVCAFDMRPLWKANHFGKELIMTGDERARHLDGKVDYLIECPFTEEFRKITAEEFIRDIICGLFHAKYVVVGSDFCFGRDKGGNVHVLAEYAEKYGYELITVVKEAYKNHIISSTFIRDMLRDGKVSVTNKLLGYPFEITGVVEHGMQLGSTLGFPTLNVSWPEGKLVPPRGVYLAEITLEGKKYPAISNIGIKPTVTEEGRVVLESHLLNYCGNAYGKEIKAELLEFRRPERKFKNIEEMKKAIDQDIAYGVRYFTHNRII